MHIGFLSASSLAPTSRLLVDKRRHVVAFNEVGIILNELLDSTGQEERVVVATIDHCACSLNTISLISRIADNFLALYVLESVHFRDRLVLINHHQRQAIALFDVPG